MTTPFRPAAWLANPHIQTVCPALGAAKAPTVRWRREIHELPDGDSVALDWHDLADGIEPTALLVILHGLEGSSESSYARGLANEAKSGGWLSVVLHARDCGGHPNRKPRRYHAGETADPGSVFEELSTRFPAIPMIACGYSLGGNTLLKYLGERGVETPLVAAAAVSVPFDLQGASDSISSGFSRLYQWHLMRNMKKSLRQKFSPDTTLFDYEAAQKTVTFEQFDDLVTAPLHGFAGKDDYYGSCSSNRFLPEIRTPTTIIHALDDPFIARHYVPENRDVSDQVSLDYTERGGHVGFVEGKLPGQLKFWLPGRICWQFQRMLATQGVA